MGPVLKTGERGVGGGLESVRSRCRARVGASPTRPPSLPPPPPPPTQTHYPSNVLADCQNVSALALAKGKVLALGETGIADGIQEVSNSSWWKSDFMNPLLNDPSCSKLSYALTFANESPDRYWVPLKGNPTWPSFIEFYQVGSGGRQTPSSMPC